MNNLFKILMVLMIVGAASACTDILDDAQPSTALSEEVTLGDAGGINAFRAGIYDRLHSTSYQTNYMLGPSALADGLASRPTTTRLSGLAENSRGSGLSTYGAAFDLINDANIMIHVVDGKKLPDGVYEQYKAEALTLRAFAMHHLVRALGYEPGMEPTSGLGANFNLGIEIRTTPTSTASDADYRPRKTNVEVYTQIKDDLKSAIALFAVNGDAGNKAYVNKATAEALLARVYLYERDFPNADKYAGDALASTSATLATPAQVATMFDEGSGDPEAIFEISVDPSTESLGINNSLSAYTSKQWMAMVPTQDLIDLYDATDARLGWFGPCVNDAQNPPVTISNCLASHPALGPDKLEIQKWEGDKGSFTDDVPLFRVAELLLIQSEARLRGTLGNALAPINELRTNRGIAPLVTLTLDDILDERRREFVGEGQRFWDLKRLGRTIRKAPELLSGIIQDVPYTDYRVLDNYPTDEVALSESNAPEGSVLIQNPGY
jgi:hypothetical protein